MNKKQPFSQLISKWGLSPDISTEELLTQAKKRLAADVEDPELSFIVAEILRHLGNEKEATQTYKEAIKKTDEKTDSRLAILNQRISQDHKDLKNRLLFLIIVPLLAISFACFFIWKTLTEPELLPPDSNPEQFTFTEWLAEQQMSQIMTNLQKQNPELTFDLNASANAQSQMEFMQSLLEQNALNSLKQEQQAITQETNSPGRPAFQCSKEPAVSCAAGDIPNAPGNDRKEVISLMAAYNSVLINQTDCSKIEDAIENIGKKISWRKSERRIKANLEDLAVECFYREKNIDKTIEHARKLQCTGDEGYINSVYWYMTSINHYAGNESNALSSYQCFQEATDYISTQGFSPAYVASRYREAGALAWLYFDNLETATSSLLKGRQLLKDMPEKSMSTLLVISEINLDLMETYVTANIDRDTFDSLLEEINTSGLLTDGYKQIKDTLAAIYNIQNSNQDNALAQLNNLSSRFNLMPEYICGWDWSGFERSLNDSIEDDETRQQLKTLVSAADCYIPQTMQQRIDKVNNVSQWIRSQ